MRFWIPWLRSSIPPPLRSGRNNRRSAANAISTILRRNAVDRDGEAVKGPMSDSFPIEVGKRSAAELTWPLSVGVEP